MVGSWGMSWARISACAILWTITRYLSGKVHRGDEDSSNVSESCLDFTAKIAIHSHPPPVHYIAVLLF